MEIVWPSWHGKTILHVDGMISSLKKWYISSSSGNS